MTVLTEVISIYLQETQPPDLFSWLKTPPQTSLGSSRLCFRGGEGEKEKNKGKDREDGQETKRFHGKVRGKKERNGKEGRGGRKREKKESAPKHARPASVTVGFRPANSLEGLTENA